MSITDLKDTTWVLNSSLDLFPINCECSGTFSYTLSDGSILSDAGIEVTNFYRFYSGYDYRAIGLGIYGGVIEDYISINAGYCMFDELQGVVNTITFTDGDTTNETLIAYMKANARQYKPSYATFDLSTLRLDSGIHTIYAKARASEYKTSNTSNHISYEVIDLTNTVWRIPSGWTASYGYDIFDVDYWVDQSPTRHYWSSLAIGFKQFGSYTTPQPYTNKLLMYPDGEADMGIEYNPSSSITLAITGGADVRNLRLIAWLQENAIPYLTNTTWIVNEGVTAAAGYGRFKINFTHWRSDKATAEDNKGLYVGYSGHFEGNGFEDSFITPTANRIVTYPYASTVTAGDIITFHNGEDLASLELSEWVMANCNTPSGKPEIVI